MNEMIPLYARRGKGNLHGDGQTGRSAPLRFPLIYVNAAPRPERVDYLPARLASRCAAAGSTNMRQTERVCEKYDTSKTLGEGFRTMWASASPVRRCPRVDAVPVPRHVLTSVPPGRSGSTSTTSRSSSASGMSRRGRATAGTLSCRATPRRLRAEARRSAVLVL